MGRISGFVITMETENGLFQSTGKGFFQKLHSRIDAVDSLLCVGLDPHSSELRAPASAEAAFLFCEKLIKETHSYACCYKPNSAFFEAFGSKGIAALERVCAVIPEDIPIILDAKRGDIGSTAKAYASAVFDSLQADAVTVNAYMGRDAIQPFLSYRNKGTFVLVKTSNKSSDELQTLPVLSDTTQAADSAKAVPLYVQVATVCNDVARDFVEADSPPASAGTLRHNGAGGGLGLVVGATDIEALRQVRKACPDLCILAPGVGAQGGDLSAALQAGLCKDGRGMIIPISRGISQSQDMAAQANAYRQQINTVRRQILEEHERSDRPCSS